MKLYIIILKGIINRKMKGIKVKDLKIECEYFDCEIPQEYLEKEPGGPITDEDIKEFFLKQQNLKLSPLYVIYQNFWIGSKKYLDYRWYLHIVELIAFTNAYILINNFGVRICIGRQFGILILTGKSQQLKKRY